MKSPNKIKKIHSEIQIINFMIYKKDIIKKWLLSKNFMDKGAVKLFGLIWNKDKVNINLLYPVSK